MYRELIEVTSLNRPDPSWRFVDRAGHEHRWFVVGDDTPATGYSPMRRYHVPSTVEVTGAPVWVGDEVDGEEYTPTYLTCRECGERVSPGSCADTHRQFVPGLSYPD